jgi:hypothetical protein
MNGRLTYFEHAAGGKPELDVVEFKETPDAETVALRVALMRTSGERDFWRRQYEQLVRDVRSAAARGVTPNTVET